MLLRLGFLKKCPRWGGGHIYATWCRMKERCPTCGYLFEREPGFFVGAYLINFAIVEGFLFIMLMGFIAWKDQNPDAGMTWAIVIGLFGVAASFSAQVLARRKEFGLLAHLGFTRRQTIVLVSLESLAWLAAGCIVGVALGLAIAVVLVQVVNPQSFHWTMELRLPWGRLALLCAAMAAAGTITAWWSGRAAGARQAALAVKEDW